MAFLRRETGGGKLEMRGLSGRRCLSRLLLPILLFLWLFPAAGIGEAALRGYSDSEGYVYVTLGRYPQTAEGEIQPILWRVLAADDEKCILLSEYILFARCMNASLLDYRDVFRGDFGKTDLCAYLNGEFTAEAFPDGETDLLLPLEGIGKVFLPAADDLKNKSYGLGYTTAKSGQASKLRKNPGLCAWGTEWAIKNNGYDPAVYTKPKMMVEGSSKKEMPLHELRLFVYSDKWAHHSPYWTRDPTDADGRHARCITANGHVGHIEVGRDNEGVRPMIHLAQGTFAVASGDGTMDHPYVIVRKGE